MLALATVAGGCSMFGPRSVPGDRFHYNEAGVESSKEQILLNLVRLSDGKPIYFVEIGSMLSQYSFQANGAISGWRNDIHGVYGRALSAVYPNTGDPIPAPALQRTYGANLSYSDTPTIMYRPLAGAEFSNRVMAPIPLATLLHLAQSGWSIDRLLMCCAQKINGIANRALDDTPATTQPDRARFARAAFLFKRLQDAGQLEIGDESIGGVVTPVLYMPDRISRLEDEVRELRTLLGYPLEGELRLRVTPNAIRHEPDELTLDMRSVMGVMHALAQECVVPRDAARTDATHVREVTEETDESMTGWMRIERSRLPKADPFVQVHYGGGWFSISKTDWSSKRTFALLTYLFSLQATDVGGQSAPVVTVEAGR